MGWSPLIVTYTKRGDGPWHKRTRKGKKKASKKKASKKKVSKKKVSKKKVSKKKASKKGHIPLGILIKRHAELGRIIAKRSR